MVSSKRRDSTPEADTAFLSSLLFSTDEDAPDVLTLYDCCHPLCIDRRSPQPTRAVIESLCAGGFESEVPMPGPDSFTFALVDELSDAASKEFPVSIPELHKKLICRLENFQKRAQWNSDGSRRIINGAPVFTTNGRRTPVHITLSVNEPLRTIMLAPISQSQRTNGRPLIPNDVLKSSSKKHESPGVLLIVRVLEDEHHVKDKVRNWLINSPAGVVEFKGFYQSYSTLIVVKVAFEVWDLLPQCDAVSFAGFAVSAPTVDQFTTPRILPSMGSITSEDVTTLGPSGAIQLRSGPLKVSIVL